MVTGNPGDIAVPLTAQMCCLGCVPLAALVVWIILGSTATKNGGIGGLIGGSISAGAFATLIFPNEIFSLVDGIFGFAVAGGFWGMLGGVVAGSVLLRNEAYGENNTLLVNWTTAGALLGPLLAGALAALGALIADSDISQGFVVMLMLAITVGAILGSLIGADSQRRQTLKDKPKLSVH